MRRTLLGMSQEKLGEAIGLTFQQVQKYERGSNRISAGTLYRLGQVLDVPVSFFFDTYNDPDGSRRRRGFEESNDNDTQISRREARLLRLWRAAPSHVSDEMLSLLSALSPEIREPAEGPGEDDEDDGQPPSFEGAPADDNGQGGGWKGVSASAMIEANGTRAASRAIRSDMPRVKAAGSDDASGKDKGKRRRHGAVWDPTDILRASKPSPRD